MVAAGFEAAAAANHHNDESNNLQEEMDFEDEDLGAPNAAAAARQTTSQSAADDTAMLMDLDNFDYKRIEKKIDSLQKESELLTKLSLEQQLSTPNNHMTPVLSNAASIKQKLEADARSIFVNQVEYSSTAKQLQEHFNGCGTVNRITIMKNHLGHPKGCAYIEFESPESVSLAMALDNSLFNGRGIQVAPKRTNKPGMKAKRFLPPSSFGRGRGRGGRGRARKPYNYY